MKLSVNMLTFNGETAFIERAIEAVLPFVDEVIVCDTGSTDKTMDVLANYPITYFREDVQHLGRVWTGSPIDSKLTELLNEVKQRSNGQWILKVDDDEIFPKNLMLEVRRMVDTNPLPEIFSIPCMNIGKDTAYFLIKRLFKNIPNVLWEGLYGRETLTLNGKRVPSRKCPSLKNHFFHLGQLRKNIHERKHVY